MPLRPHPMEMFSAAVSEGTDYVTRQCKSIEAFDRHVVDTCNRFGYALADDRTLEEEAACLREEIETSDREGLRMAARRFAVWLEVAHAIETARVGLPGWPACRPMTNARSDMYRIAMKGDNPCRW